MSNDTNFTPRVTRILAAWLQDVNDAVYRFLQNGAGAVQRTLREKLGDVDPTLEDFGAVGDGITDDAGAVSLAITACSGRTIRVREKTYLIKSQLTIPDSAGTRLKGYGIKSVIKKGANIDMLSLGMLGVLEDLCLDGNGAVYTGRGVVVSTGALDDASWRKFLGVHILNMASYCIEYTTARAGYASHHEGCRFSLDGADKWTTFCVKQPDVEANNGNRMFTECWSFGHRFIDLGGADNTLLANCQGALPQFSASSKKTSMAGCRWVTTGDGAAMTWTIDGISTAIAACTINGTFNSPGVVFAATLAQAAIGENAWVSGMVFSDLSSGQSAGNEINIRNVTYSPTWTGAGAPAIGNGTLNGAYQRDGERCHFNIRFEPNTTTTFGTGAWSFSLPYTAARNSVVSVYMEDATGPAIYVGVGYIQQDATTVRVATANSTSAYAKSDTPFTWAAAVGDKMFIEGDFVIK